MARQKRLNIPGAIYHVITRGLNGTAIFKDAKDRKEFLTRLSTALEKTNCLCYSWVLMTNHIHLLLRPIEKSLSETMRKILTGYAITFNHRHKRRGYLYQNRYKSILCQEDRYFMELIRYIHLNPVRAGMIKNIEELNSYPWSGHSAILGKTRNIFQSIDEVLQQFSSKRSFAIESYQEFVKDGWTEGKREDLTGGGLKRSAGGWERLLEMKKMKEFWRGDERILGNDDYIVSVLKKAEEEMLEKDKYQQAGWTLAHLVERVCNMMSVTEGELKKRGRMNNISFAKGLIAYWGYNELGMSGSAIARYFGIKRPSLDKLIAIGERVVNERSLKLIS